MAGPADLFVGEVRFQDAVEITWDRMGACPQAGALFLATPPEDDISKYALGR